nr:hydroxymethylglutaryl-CoA synthase family protein [Streptococcus lutetiensis]
MTKIGIKSYGVALPYLRLPVEETLKVWKNASVPFIKNKMGVDRRTVVASDEDTLTLAIDAGKDAVKHFNGKVDADIDSVLLGSCSTPDIFKSNANQLMSFLTDNKNYFGCDIRASENSGVSSLVLGYSLVKSRLSKNSLIFSSDTLSKNIFPSELRESYIGSGASSIILGSGEDVVAEIISVGNSNDSFPEQCRTEDSRYVRILANLNSDVIKEGMIKRCIESINDALESAGLSSSDIAFFSFPENTGAVYSQLSNYFKGKKIATNQSLFKNLGYVGSASPIISMLLNLEKAKVGDLILLCGYGHSSGATSIILKVNKEVELNDYVYKKINNYKDVDYSEAMKSEFKYSQPEIALGTFI